MEDYSGNWVGEMEGTNFGSFTAALKQEGQAIQGKAKFREPKYGNYECAVTGTIGSAISLRLTPTLNPSVPNLGPIDVTALPERDGRMTGQWKSIHGTGKFLARRESASDSPSTPGTSSLTRVSPKNVAPAHALWVELATRAIGVRHLVTQGREIATIETVFSFFGRTRELMTQHPDAREFNDVALAFLESVLRPFTTRWHSWASSNDPDAAIPENLQESFHQEHGSLQIKAFGVRKALEALKQRKMYEPRWIRPDDEMLAALTQEFRNAAPILEEKRDGTSNVERRESISTGGRFAATREAKERELCLNIDAYANAIADTFTSAAEENDFVFALYGAWGRGKSTLMKRVAHILGGSAASAESQRDYAPIFFSAWKYPTRPEVWVHLYQRVVKSAQKSGVWQKLRVSFRIGLLRKGWAPLLLGFSFLAVSRLQLDFARWLFNGFGLVGALIIGSFVWNAAKLRKQFAQSYFSMPNHGEKLGLQAVIGEDLNNLLTVWINPRVSTVMQTDKRTLRCDFSRWWPARCALLGVVGLIWVTLALIIWKLDRHEQKDAQLQMSESTRALSAEQADLFLYCSFGGFALALPVLAIAIARRPTQHERVLLIVDDLDRCEPDQMLAVIESLRLFLDDEEMSRRLQVAMLIDRRILYRTIIDRAEKTNILQSKDSKEKFFRQQEEKLFVASMELPPLDATQARELATLIVNREYREQLEADMKSAGKTITESDLAQGEPAKESEGTKRPIGLETTIDPDLTFSDEERQLLTQAVTNIDPDQITPRSYRSFVLRYQLIRLILHRLNQPFEPSAIITYLSTRLFSGSKLSAPQVHPVVGTAIHSVVGFDVSKPRDS
jgi:hypothetical protein